MIIFSINVHEKIIFLLKQIQNIEKYVKVKYKIIINPNSYMFNEITKNNFIQNLNYIFINNPCDKKLYHGSLSKGIYLNMEYAINNFEFDYFIILSSRNFFYREINDKNIKSFVKICKGPQQKYVSGLVYGGGGITYNELKIDKNRNIEQWHWPKFKNTELFKYIQNNNLLFSSSTHEGLCFDINLTKKIVNFLNTYVLIKNDLFDFDSCVEEFALQSICINLGNNYYHIGNSSQTDNINNLSQDKFVCKVFRN